MKKFSAPRKTLAGLGSVIAGVALVLGGLPGIASAADQTAGGCERQVAELRSVQEQIDVHNAKPHVFELPREQAKYDAYNAEADQLDAAQQRALDNLRECEQPQSSADLHEEELGTDPATGKYRAGEAETGLRIEQERGITLRRAPAQSGVDWIGSDGKTYDAVGNFPGRFFDRQWGRLKYRIEQHLDKADYVPVDVSQFTGEQIDRVREFIEPFAPRVFIVGE